MPHIWKPEIRSLTGAKVCKELASCSCSALVKSSNSMFWSFRFGRGKTETTCNTILVGNIAVHGPQRVDFSSIEPMINKSVSMFFKHLPIQNTHTLFPSPYHRVTLISSDIIVSHVTVPISKLKELGPSVGRAKPQRWCWPPALDLLEEAHFALLRDPSKAVKRPNIPTSSDNSPSHHHQPQPRSRPFHRNSRRITLHTICASRRDRISAAVAPAAVSSLVVRLEQGGRHQAPRPAR